MARDLSGSQGFWSARDTSPGEIEGAIRALLAERHARDQAYVPARVLNLVLIVEREYRGEIVNRLERVGRYHPSRTVLCVVEQGRTALDAEIVTTVDESAGLHVAQERVQIAIGPQHLPRLDSIVDPLVITDLATVVWSPHGHPEAVDSLRRNAQVVLLDTADEPDSRAALLRARELSDHAYVVDLGWLRSTPWRERVSATFDPPLWRDELGRLSTVTVTHHPSSAVSGLLLFGWLATRLGWETGALVSQNGSLHGRARSRRQEVAFHLEPEERMNVPGLAGITMETASGVSISLDRGEGGLRARRRMRDGSESEWTILGASRGEAGILGEGIRQALLRDPTYRPALDAAWAMLG